MAFMVLDSKIPISAVRLGVRLLALFVINFESSAMFELVAVEIVAVEIVFKLMKDLPERH